MIPNNKTRVLLLGDSRWRDSFGLALLKYEFNQLEGYLAEVAGFDLAFPAVSYFQPHALVLNHVIGKRNVKLAAMVRRMGGKVVVLPTEGRPNTDKLRRWHDEHTEKSLVDLYCAWGEGTKEHLQDIPYVVSGCPRFAIYNEYRHLIPSRSEMCGRTGMDERRKIITIATSFPQAKFHFHSQTFHKQDSKDLRIYNEYEAQAIPATEWKKMQSLRQVVQGLILKHPEYQYIMKAHPMEDIRLWQAWCEEWGVHLFNGYIWEFLALSDLHIARSPCLTALEAYMMGVPAYIYDNGVNEQHDLFPKLWEWEVGDFSYCENERVGAYLENIGLVQQNSALKIVKAVSEKIDAPKKNKGTSPFSAMLPERVNLIDFQRILAEHDHVYPQQDSIGHYGKAVTQSVIRGFEEQLK